MKIHRLIAYLFVLLCFTTVLAQATTCSPIAQQAMAAAQQDCAATARNQACYGYLSLQATAQAGVQNFTFSHQGDVVDVADLASLQLTPYDPAKNTWGIALMKLQANLPDTLPGENVIVLLFGNVQIQNAVSPTDPNSLQPMQAFYFRTGVTQTSCENAPSNGILIQTPKGAGKVDLMANNVDIQLGSTAYLEAQPDQQMSFYVVEGDSSISYGGKTVDVPAGAVSSVPIDANLSADDVPSDPTAYNADDVADLPIDGLPDDITIAPPADAQTIETADQETVLQPTDQSTGEQPTDQVTSENATEQPTDQVTDVFFGAEATAESTIEPFAQAQTDQAPSTENADSSGGG